MDWYERQTLLRVAFNTLIHANRARYDIQYGNLERSTNNNTSWEQAKFESVAHKWADLSQRDYGLALLNDCKYGYRIKDSQISLTLLKSGIYPDIYADQGKHDFVYSLLPHKGDFLTGQVEKNGLEVNRSLGLYPWRNSDSLSCLLNFKSDFPVSLDAFKISEVGNNLIVRFHDYSGTNNKVQVNPQFNFKEVETVNLAENKVGKIKVNENNLFIIKLKPYKIVTLKFLLKGSNN